MSLDLKYAFLSDESGPYLAMSYLCCFQEPVYPKKGWFSKKDDLTQTADAKHVFYQVYYTVDISTGEMTSYSNRSNIDQTTPRIELNRNYFLSKAEKTTKQGYSFIISGFETVDKHTFTGIPKPNWIGHRAHYEVASMLKDGTRAIYALACWDHSEMIELSSKIRMLISPIIDAQSEKQDDLIKLFKLRETSNDPEAARLRASLLAHFSENFKAPEFLF